MRKRKSTRKLLNLKTITPISLQGYNKTDLIYYQIAPYNLAVLPEFVIRTKVHALLNVLKGIEELEIICLNGRENFQSNKLFIEGRIQTEKNEGLKKLLQQDLQSLDELQIQTATSRLFLFCLRIRQEKNHDLLPYLNRIEKMMQMQGLSVRRCDKEEIKKILAIYFEQNVTSDYFEDLDGERWVTYD